MIYERCADPMNKEGKMCLYAPDITVGADGRYYLYYVLTAAYRIAKLVHYLGGIYQAIPFTDLADR